MSSARYLVRFDDICPTMDWDKWGRVEKALIASKVIPILAVVPDNRDGNLNIFPPRTDFWEMVRKWQKMGWTIALHGYEHKYETRCAGLIGVNERSEFAGLSRQTQRDKLEKALRIFSDNAVVADAWIAPGHSFDAVTVELLLELGIDVISDGYFPHPLIWLGAKWIPQQLWRFYSLPMGTWTVCYHVNSLSDAGIDNLISTLGTFRNQIVSVEEILARGQFREITLLDRFFAWSWRLALQIRRLVKGLR